MPCGETPGSSRWSRWVGQTTRMTPSVAARPTLSPGEGPPSLFAIGVSFTAISRVVHRGARPNGLIAPSHLASVATLPTNSPRPHAPTFRQNWRGHRADHRCGLRAVADLYHVLRDRTGRPTDRADGGRGARREPRKLSRPRQRQTTR